MLELDAILKSAINNINNISTLAGLEQLRIKFLGKSGELTLILKTLGKLDALKRPQAGVKINKAKQQLQQLIKQKQQQLLELNIKEKLIKEKIDITLPVEDNSFGTLHPVTQTLKEIEDIFSAVGFNIVFGPEIEDDFHNFSALNIPAHHPARAMHDTFYFADNKVLRTHTSSVQIRTMQDKKAPIRIIAPGKVYRCDYDITHSPMFHQIEGLVVDKDVNFAELKGLLIDFVHVFFANNKLKIRFRPSYFPFTEPSAELDISCVMCNGRGCRVCSNTGWLEVLGCGIVHPNVFKAVEVDSEKYTGLAFGMGIERLSMLKYGIDDLRLFFENNLSFLKQFRQ